MIPGVDLPRLALSPACLEDGPFLLALRNHPDTRRWSFSGEEITQKEHEAWLALTLAAHDRRLYIATDCGISVGTGRLDLDPDTGEAEVSVTVHWDHQGCGIGTALIEALAR